MRQFDYSKLTKISYDSEIISYISKINQYCKEKNIDKNNYIFFE